MLGQLIWKARWNVRASREASLTDLSGRNRKSKLGQETTWLRWVSYCVLLNCQGTGHSNLVWILSENRAKRVSLSHYMGLDITLISDQTILVQLRKIIGQPQFMKRGKNVSKWKAAEKLKHAILSLSWL